MAWGLGICEALAITVLAVVAVVVAILVIGTLAGLCLSSQISRCEEIGRHGFEP